MVPGPSRTRAGGPVCNALPDPVATGDLVIAVGPVPAGVGGDVVDGTYVFTGGNYYGGGAGGVPGTVLATIGATVVLSAGNYDEISSFPGQQTETSSGTITFAGTTGSSTSSCPSVQSGAGDYTFDGATLTFYGPDSSESYALQ